MPTTLSVVAETIVALAKLGLIGYSVNAGRVFLLAWLESRKGLPLFATPRITPELLADAMRKAGMDPQTDPPTN